MTMLRTLIEVMVHRCVLTPKPLRIIVQIKHIQLFTAQPCLNKVAKKRKRNQARKKPCLPSCSFSLALSQSPHPRQKRLPCRDLASREANIIRSWGNNSPWRMEALHATTQRSGILRTTMWANLEKRTLPLSGHQMRPQPWWARCLNPGGDPATQESEDSIPLGGTQIPHQNPEMTMNICCSKLPSFRVIGYKVVIDPDRSGIKDAIGHWRHRVSRTSSRAEGWGHEKKMRFPLVF